MPFVIGFWPTGYGQQGYLPFPGLTHGQLPYSLVALSWEISCKSHKMERTYIAEYPSLGSPDSKWLRYKTVTQKAGWGSRDSEIVNEGSYLKAELFRSLVWAKREYFLVFPERPANCPPRIICPKIARWEHLGISSHLPSSHQLKAAF